MTERRGRRRLVAHADVLMNFAACACVAEMLDQLSYELLLPEATFSHPSLGVKERKTIEGLDYVRVVPVPPDAASVLVKCCEAGLRDADAHVVALASVQRGSALLTDDRRVARIARECAPAVEVRCTLSLLKYAFEHLGLDDRRIMECLTAMRVQAEFRPRSTPLGAWFHGYVDMSAIAPA